MKDQQLHEIRYNLISTSLIIREMQIKTTTIYYVMPFRMVIIKMTSVANAGEDAEKRKPWCTVGGIVNWLRHYRK